MSIIFLELIPFGWGQYSGNCNDYSDDDTLHYDRATLSTNDNDADGNSSPHRAMAYEMKNLVRLLITRDFLN